MRATYMLSLSSYLPLLLPLSPPPEVEEPDDGKYDLDTTVTISVYVLVVVQGMIILYSIHSHIYHPPPLSIFSRIANTQSDASIHPPDQEYASQCV